MIRDLDGTVSSLLTDKAPIGSELASADISFDIPDSKWRNTLNRLSVNCYLYDIRENHELRTYEPVIKRGANNEVVSYREAPRRISCSYCITAWSTANSDGVLEEHRTLSQVLQVLLTHRTIPIDVLKGSLVDQIPPYPTVIAAADGMKENPHFWSALDQQLKPSLNYVVTLAMLLDEEQNTIQTPQEVRIVTQHKQIYQGLQDPNHKHVSGSVTTHCHPPKESQDEF